jgi:CheY-like chemotaxis protein
MHKLLLADDSVTIQRVIELTFSGEDVQVLAVNDGEQAIARIPLERPDVVLADIGMPRKGGYEVSAFVKGRADLAHIPVLLLAGAFEPVDQARAEQVKADGVLIKPFEPRQVIERVKELLAAVPQAPAAPPAPEPAPVIFEPELMAAPAAEAPASGEAEPVQSLDDLFESLNQALHEPAKAAPPAPSEPEPHPQLEAEFEAEPQPQLEAEFEPEPFVLEPPIAFEPLTPPSNGATLDEYFDRLSAAFEQAGAPPPRLFQPMPERLEDLTPAAPSAAAPPPPANEWPAQEWLSPGGATLSFDRRGDEVNPILEAVTALMAPGADSGSAKAAAPAWPDPPAAPQPELPAASQAMVDAVTERVLARLVPEVTERLQRLVQQEIARTQHDVH